MKPERSNYEIWFSDWIDGALNNKQEEELMLFLRDNPDLLEEFEELPLIYITPDSVKFSGKEGIKRTADSYSEEQFEYLCIAHLENDLSADQVSELMDIVAHNDQKKRTFELFTKLKLTPVNHTFTRKSSVKKITTGGRIIRWSAIGLSSAAAAAILFVTYMSVYHNNNSNGQQAVLGLSNDTMLIKTSPAMVVTDQFIPPDPAQKLSEILNAAKNPVLPGQDVLKAKQDFAMEHPDPSESVSRAGAINTAYVPFQKNITLRSETPLPGLQAYNPGSYIPPLADDGRSNVEKYFARFFHEKIMKDRSSGNRPVESYELARAGIEGLNKLFGWEMTLSRNTDNNGELRSYYYSSKLLKVNAPVKKPGKDL